MRLFRHEDLFSTPNALLTGKQRIAHKPNSKPKLDAVFDLKEEDEENEGARKNISTEEELWARLDELEKLEELQDEQDRYVNTTRAISNFNMNINVSWKCTSSDYLTTRT